MTKHATFRPYLDFWLRNINIARQLFTLLSMWAAGSLAATFPFDQPEPRQAAGKSLESGQTWTRRMNGMTGGNVNDLAIDPADSGTIWAGTDAGLFRSTDAGVNWAAVPLPLSGRVDDIEINAFDRDLMHATVPCAYLRSTDRGQNWTVSFPGPCVERVDIDSANNRVLLHDRNGASNALYSTDGGMTFQPLPLPDSVDISGISMDVIHGVPGGYLVAYGSFVRKLYRTTDNGATWDDITSNVTGASLLNLANVASRPGHSSEFLLSELDFGGSGASIIHQSTDGGQTWMQVATGAFPPDASGTEFQFDPANNALVHYVDLRTTDGGFNWTNLGAGIGVRGRSRVTTATNDAPGRIYAGGEGFGVEISNNSGATWTRSNAGLDAAAVVDHALTADAAVAIANRQGVFRSTSFGEQWTRVPLAGIEETDAVAVGFTADGSEGLATFSGANVRTLATSDDGGMTWSAFDLTAQVDAVGRVVALGGGNALVSARAGGEAGVLRVGIDGSVAGFSAFANGVSGFPPDIALAVDPGDATSILAGFSDDPVHVFASADAGVSWVPAGAGINEQIGDLTFDPTVGGRVFAINDNGIYESLDSGASFSLRSARPGGAGTLAASDRFAGYLVAGRTTSDRGGLVSADGGATWLDLGDRLDTGGNWLPRSIRSQPGGTRLMANDGDNGRVGLAVRSIGVVSSQLAPNELDVGDRFGRALAASGARIAVGVPGDDDAGGDAGAVYIYRIEGIGAVLEQKIAAPAGAVAGFGGAIALEGERLVIGSLAGITSKGQPNPNALRAAIFERVNQNWQLKAELSSGSSATDDAFGSVVAVGGDMVLVGAPQDDEAGTDSGAVFQFEANATSVQFSGKIMSSSPVPGGKFGQGLAVSSGAAAIGSPFSPDNPLTTGVVELYQRVGNNLAQVSMISGESENGGDLFGSAIALSGNSVVVAAPGESGNAGAAYLFNFDGASAIQEGRVTASIASIDGSFGSTVAAGDGQIAIAAPGRDEVYLFDESLSRIETYDAVANQIEFGVSAAISGEVLAIGAPGTTDSTGSVALILNTDRISGNGFE